MKIFGLKTVLRAAIFCACFILIFLLLGREKFLLNPMPIVGPVLGALILIILQTTIIITQCNLLQVYTLFTFLARRPRKLFIDEIQKMHIVRITGRGGGTYIHLMIRNEETTINTQFAKSDIKSLEQFMIEKGVEVQHPEK